MGGRGSFSRFQGRSRFGRGQLPEWRNNDDALRQLMLDTGFTEAQARIAQMNLIRYFGADYGSFTSGQLPKETKIITQALLRMPHYNGGDIYRGIDVTNDVADKFLRDWKPGTRQTFGILQSFSSREDVADGFSNWNYGGSDSTSIKFVMVGNKTAPGTQHLSKFGESEAEVLSPHTQHFSVLRTTTAVNSSEHRQITIYIKDEGTRKKRKNRGSS